MTAALDVIARSAPKKADLERTDLVSRLCPLDNAKGSVVGELMDITSSPLNFYAYLVWICELSFCN